MAGSHTSFDARFPSDYDLETARRFADELKLEDTRFSSHVYMHRLRVGGSSLVDHTHCEPALSANADPIELKLYPGFNCGIEDVCTAVSRTACAADRPVVFDYFGLVCVVDPGDSIATVSYTHLRAHET